MKRSEVNKALRELEAMCQKYRCYLPLLPFTRRNGNQRSRIRRSPGLLSGLDITDYGQGISIRSDSPHHHPQRQPDHAGKIPQGLREKLLFLKEGQYSPNHFHWYKTEDIINRGAETC